VVVQLSLDHSNQIAVLIANAQPFVSLFFTPAAILRGAEFGKPGSRLSIPFSADVTDHLLSVIRSALALNTPKLSEPALACIHKLVAYAYLQGETRPSGRLDDADNVVTRIVGMTARCGNSSTPAVQLAVVRALLTLATAEHFAAHGDCLMLSVRTVFNIAMGGVNADIQNTAKSALLQMVNTILKRVAQQVIVSWLLSLCSFYIMFENYNGD